MKTLLAIALLSLSIGLSFSSSNESTPNESNDTAVNCTFTKNVLSCQYLVESVKCDAFSNIVNLTVLPMQIFGIGALNNDSASDSELVKISLYPRVLDLPVYLLSSIKVDGIAVNMSLYYSLSETDTGIRIIDKECFTRLLNFIKNVQKLHRVSVQQNMLGDSQDVDLFGLLVINNLDTRKVRYFSRGSGWGRGGFKSGWNRGGFKSGWNRGGYKSGWNRGGYKSGWGRG
ncbi:asparagine-rich antigen [Brachionus plicatilis]|uniref:Asparagine-rich antigen n=1 Tax=Brachionus plicatilis TaxID=10195 RepID=A0A3M7RW54_BRAPC|nr:asparagine-rich antigen [Brachionus plicatilis]